jgi:hypothetical protein
MGLLYQRGTTLLMLSSLIRLAQVYFPIGGKLSGYTLSCLESREAGVIYKLAVLTKYDTLR